jgi:hypothetical protein
MRQRHLLANCGVAAANVTVGYWLREKWLGLQGRVTIMVTVMVTAMVMVLDRAMCVGTAAEATIPSDI